MDSMRSLNSSLPNSAPPSKPHSSEQLLQAFKSAALSVTNLYKSAISDQADSRQEGYQDALEDLLRFLDKKDLGLMDGEGWKVRQWATEKYNRMPGTSNASDSEDDGGDDEGLARQPSPSRQSKQGSSRQPSPNRKESSLPPSSLQQQNLPLQPSASNPPMFTFTAAEPDVSRDMDMATSDVQAEEQSRGQLNESESIGKRSETPVRLEIVGKGSRTPHRYNTGSRQRSSNRDIHINNATKRKMPFPDFFDLSNIGINFGKDSTGVSNKRGRFT